MNVVNSLIRDIRYAVRILLKSPVATSVAVLALALGIGVNSSIFITVSSLILHPLPYPHLERIVTIWETPPKLHDQKSGFAPANLIDLKNGARSFQKLADYREWDASLTSVGTPERLRALLVSPSFFSVLGTGAELGRVIATGEDHSAHSRVAVVSEGFWKGHLGGSPGAIGKSISLDGRTYTVIGVMPDSFDYPLGTQLWSPLTLDPAEEHERSSHNLMVLGLLKPGVSAAEAGAEASTIASRLEHEYPKTNQDRSMLVLPLRDLTDQVTDRFVITLLGAAGFVLLLACANIGNLQLARATNREREIAVRAALGASRFEIARQLFTESILISAAAGVVGLLLASWNNDLMKSSISPLAMRLVPGLRTMHVDSTVVLLTMIASLVAGILCGLPAISQVVNRKMRADLNDVLRGRGGSASATPARNRVRTSLVVFELTLALVLLVGAGLMVKTFERFLYLNQGFDPRNLLTMQVSLPATQYQGTCADQIVLRSRTARPRNTSRNRGRGPLLQSWLRRPPLHRRPARTAPRRATSGSDRNQPSIFHSNAHPAGTGAFYLRFGPPGVATRGCYQRERSPPLLARFQSYWSQDEGRRSIGLAHHCRCRRKCNRRLVYESARARGVHLVRSISGLAVRIFATD